MRAMKTFSMAKAFLALAAACCACPLFADFVSSSDGDLKDVSVSSFDGKSVALSDGRRLDASKVRFIEFSAFEVPAKPSFVILKDGSLFNGLLKGKSAEALSFRSTSLGPLELPASSVAAYVYDGESFAALDAAKLPPPPCVVQKDGSASQGKILWADGASAGVMSPDGLLKLEASSLACVLYAPYAKGAQALLRNGDVLNGKLSFQGDSLNVELEGGVLRNVKLKALRRINLKQ